MPNIPHLLSTFVPTCFNASIDIVQDVELVLETFLDVVSFLRKREDFLLIHVDIVCIEDNELRLDGGTSLPACLDLGCEVESAHLGISKTLTSFHPVFLCSVKDDKLVPVGLPFLNRLNRHG